MEHEVITVKYALIDDAHFFTSDDELALGLCAAHQDLKLAFEETAVQLKTLLKLNHDLDMEVEPTVPFEDFKNWVATWNATWKETPNPHIRPRVTSEVDWHRRKVA